MKINIKSIYILTMISFLVASCSGKMTFEEQIAKDVESKMGTGICEDIPKGSEIKNVKVGTQTPIGDTGLIDVEIEFDSEINGESNHHQDAVLYSKEGENYTLEALGNCDYIRGQ